MLQEYYNLLDLPHDATANEIKRAYRMKAKRYHPDANHEPEAHFQFIRIKEAFDILLKFKHQENYSNYYPGRFYHPRDPYFQSSQQYHTHYTHHHAKNEHGERGDLHDFLDSKAGRAIYVAVHLFFIVMGLIIFAGPLYTMMTRGFDPYISLFDSIFATVAAMIFGVIMMVKISVSLLRFIKKGI
jgi:curved DNA-binding protein CbpA